MARGTGGMQGTWRKLGRGGAEARNPENAGLLGGELRGSGAAAGPGGANLALPSPAVRRGAAAAAKEEGLPSTGRVKAPCNRSAGLSGGRPGRGRRRVAARPRWTARPVAAQVSAGPGTGGRAGGSGAHGARAATHPRGRLCCSRRRGTMGQAGTRYRSAAPGLCGSVPGPRRSVPRYRGSRHGAEGGGEGLRAAASPPLVAGSRPRESCGTRRRARPGLPRLPAPPALVATSRVTGAALRGARPGLSWRGRALGFSRDAGTAEARQTTAKPR